MLDGDGRADRPADTAERALLIVNLKCGLAPQSFLTLLCAFLRTLILRDVPDDGLAGAYLFTDRATGTLLIVDVGYHIVLRESFLFDNGKSFFSVNLQGQGIERAHNHADAAI